MSELYYVNTRNTNERITASAAILKGLADDGGLYVPESIPQLNSEWELLAQATYQEIARQVLGLFLTDFTSSEIEDCVHRAYDQKFDTTTIAPIVRVGNVNVLELFHGATLAFKDMALSILPHLLKVAASKQQQSDKIVILTATSGDTGKAALAGFADVTDTKIIVFYPKGGVSSIQERQMVTQAGENTYVYGIHGNFDDAQSKVKELFADQALKQQLRTNGYQFSAANSINIGRLLPQVVYYVYTYAQLVKNGRIQAGERINIVVPTGNFGNILACYYAKKMGVPIAKLICASNRNRVLVDFFLTGEYNRHREFYLTSSPSMDILVSSNLERLIFELTERSAKQTVDLMRALQQVGRYQISPAMQRKLNDFFAAEANENDTMRAIAQQWQQHRYTLDPHTAVAFVAQQKYQEATNDQTETVIVATASAYKFPQSVVTAIQPEVHGLTDRQWVEQLSKISAQPIPQNVLDVLAAPIRHQTVVSIDEMRRAVFMCVVHE